MTYLKLVDIDVSIVHISDDEKAAVRRGEPVLKGTPVRYTSETVDGKKVEDFYYHRNFGGIAHEVRDTDRIVTYEDGTVEVFSEDRFAATFLKPPVEQVIDLTEPA